MISLDPDRLRASAGVNNGSCTVSPFFSTIISPPTT